MTDLSTLSDDDRARLASWNPVGLPATALGSSVNSGINVLYRDLQLNDAQIKALPTTPIEFVASDVNALFLGAFMRSDTPVSGYTNISDGSSLQFSGRWNNSQPLVNDIVAGPAEMSAMLSSGNRVVYFPPEVTTTVSTVAEGLRLIPVSLGNPLEPLALYADNADGDFTGGDPANTLSIRVWYSILPTGPFGAAAA